MHCQYFFKDFCYWWNNRNSWVAKGKSPRTVVRQSRYQPKAMITLFFRTTGVLHFSCLEKGKTINHNTYINKCLKSLVDSINQLRKTWNFTMTTRDLMFIRAWYFFVFSLLRILCWFRFCNFFQVYFNIMGDIDSQSFGPVILCIFPKVPFGAGWCRFRGEIAITAVIKFN